MTTAGAPVGALGRVVELLGRRGSLDVLAVLQGPAMTERALTRRLNQVSASVVAQRVSELRDLGVVEVVPETDELRLSPRGRRLQGLLDGLAAWADRG